MNCGERMFCLYFPIFVVPKYGLKSVPKINILELSPLRFQEVAMFGHGL